MQESIEAILRLSKEDRSIQANRNLLETFPTKKRKLRASVDRIERKLKGIKKKSTDFQQQIREREALIGIENEKIDVTDKRMLAVKNQKEYYALQKEIDTAKKTIRRMEDQILSMEEQILPLEEEQGILQEQFGKENTIYQEKARGVLVEEKKIQGQIDAYDQFKAELMGKIEPDLAASYERLTLRNVVPAAVEIDGSYCLGCAMSLPAQTFNEIIQKSRGECPHCRRILFYKAPEVVPVEKGKKKK
ncbi:MAG: hypothetical protein COB67_07805 [SAR324 cluster bacterium]|uniref:C4-type zinc ribbon domain-containing protein n=1 Tax=SAR324 cluster bacterium TaxID=2024889 RepID=A0A2A4T3R0_9DELT|nr:MAG: hypothetical protein COB67_07805 [SAR324 cluster bacterium]